MAILTRHATSDANRKIGVRRFHREIKFKGRNIIHFVIFGNYTEIGLISISDNSGASGSSGIFWELTGSAPSVDSSKNDGPIPAAVRGRARAGARRRQRETTLVSTRVY
eukprot:COSAG02_NODE_3667_length_6400_cov_3.774480_3_plen_109_part_00